MRQPKGPHVIDPFEVVLSLVFGVSSGLQVFVGPAPGSASASLPHTSLLAWLALVLFGAVLTLVGVFAKRRWGYLVEMVGLSAMGGALIAYGVQVILLQIERHGFTISSALGGPLIIGLGIGFYWKFWQVRGTVKRLHLHSWWER